MTSVVTDLPITDAQESGFGAMLIERVLEEIFRAGFAAIKADTSLIDDLFHKLDKPTRDDIKKYYEDHTVTVRQNIPRDAITFPLVAVVNTSESEDPESDVLGDYFTSEFDAARTGSSITLGHAVQSNYTIYCIAPKDANAVLYLYYLCKAILIINGTVLAAHGVTNPVLSGQDVTLREDLFPEFTYGRVLTLSCLNYFSIRQTERVYGKLRVNVFIEEPFSDTKTQANVEDP